MRTEVDKYVIAKVREMRIDRGISQRGLSAILDRAPSFVSQVEIDHIAKYSVSQLYTIAEYFECHPADFFPPVDWAEPSLRK